VAPKRKISNLLGLVVLATLVEGPKHPYEVGRLLRERGDARSIKFNPSSLYGVFAQLERAGFVEERETLREGQRPERTVYALTDGGRAEVRDWLRELVTEPRHEFPTFVTALSLITALPPDEVLELLGRRAAAVAGQRREIEGLLADAAANDVDPVFLVEERYRLALLDAEGSFIADFVKKIEKRDPAFGLVWREFHQAKEK
jgi:DNA-binding PadR family transcriptional regulator